MNPSRYRSSRQTLGRCHLVILENILFHRALTAETLIKYSISFSINDFKCICYDEFLIFACILADRGQSGADNEEHNVGQLVGDFEVIFVTDFVIFLSGILPAFCE